MLLSSLLKIIEIYGNFSDCEITGVTSQSNKVQPGSLFVCIKGSQADGHSYAAKAVSQGAGAVLSEGAIVGVDTIICGDTHAAYALLCAAMLGNPAGSLRLIAVTGTNGKTSVATIIKRLLMDVCIPCGLISTIQAEYGNVKLPLSRTTPDPYDLHKFFADMVNNGIKAVSLEASSHALEQKRLEGLHFDFAVFTNLTQDHLDYHKNMVEYYKVKKSLFPMAENAVINIDSEYGRQLLSEIDVKAVTFSTKNSKADFYADRIECTINGVRFQLCHKDMRVQIQFGIPGIYSVENALAAIAVCVGMGLSLESIADGLSRMAGISGRSEIIAAANGFTVICDYAHTPDGLRNILNSVRRFTPKRGRLILVFGCGGDRDSIKRPIMGNIAAELADFTVVTSDNPRTEAPGGIISGILKGIPHAARYIAIADRREAVRYALSIAKSGDVVVLAGKGHEQYQILGDKELYFDERRLVKGIIKSLEE